jgi:hypothetical protein
VTDVQIAVRFGRKASDDGGVFPDAQILVDDRANEM